ncbi:MAG: hypothetical protein AAFY73_04945 [Pseudomonadota bacterium]
MRIALIGIVLLQFAGAQIALAGGADVVDVNVRERSDGSFLFEVTVSHADEGWDHYANAFEIVDESGAVLGTRVLAHPHVNEQPFTRSLNSVQVPAGLSKVIVGAVDNVHDRTGKTMTVTLPGR